MSLKENRTIENREALLKQLHEIAKERQVPFETVAADSLAALIYVAEPKELASRPPPANVGMIKILIYFPATEDHDENWSKAIYDGKNLTCNDPRADTGEATHWLPWPRIPT